jgi:hypothetical protein
MNMQSDCNFRTIYQSKQNHKYIFYMSFSVYSTGENLNMNQIAFKARQLSTEISIAAEKQVLTSLTNPAQKSAQWYWYSRHRNSRRNSR